MVSKHWQQLRLSELRVTCDIIRNLYAPAQIIIGVRTYALLKLYAQGLRFVGHRHTIPLAAESACGPYITSELSSQRWIA
jgi:hypothetical protein